MRAKIFDGREYAKRKTQNVKLRVEILLKKGVKPTLATVYLPTDAGSALYTKIKGEAARGVGMNFVAREIQDPKDVDAIVSQVADLSSDSSVHGIIVQKPSGKNDYPRDVWLRIVLALSPRKDVDGLTPENLGMVMLGKPRFVPATVKAVLEALRWGKVEVAGKGVVIVGRSEILGKPLATLLTHQDATVSVVHSKTPDLASHTKRADVLVSATGVPGLIGARMVKEGAAVVDVGEPRGDVQKEVLQKVSFLSPVPGGIGPVTVSCLLENTVEAAERQS